MTNNCHTERSECILFGYFSEIQGFIVPVGILVHNGHNVGFHVVDGIGQVQVHGRGDGGVGVAVQLHVQGQGDGRGYFRGFPVGAGNDGTGAGYGALCFFGGGFQLSGEGFPGEIVDEIQDENFIFCYHNCSNAIEKKVDAVLSTGAKMFHFGDKADMCELLNTLPSDVVVMGNISPSAVFMCDSTDKMINDTQTLLRQCLLKENFMISSGCDIPAATPMENIDKFFEVINLGYHKKRLWDQINQIKYPEN